jgi:hypothetical protein
MQKLSLDTMDFDRALQLSGRDVLFTYFGDHQPNLEVEVPLSRALDEPRYLTRFTIKGPGAATERAGPEQVLDINFLGSLLLEHAGIAGDELFAASAAMRRLCGGTMRGCPDGNLVQSYRAYVYRDLGAAERAG